MNVGRAHTPGGWRKLMKEEAENWGQTQVSLRLDGRGELGLGERDLEC